MSLHLLEEKKPVTVNKFATLADLAILNHRLTAIERLLTEKTENDGRRTRSILCEDAQRAK
jgi:hypothetical protein